MSSQTPPPPTLATARPPRPAVPRDEARAIRAAIDAIGGLPAFWQRFRLNYRTAQRIYSGKQACPPRLRDDLLGTGATPDDR